MVVMRNEGMPVSMAVTAARGLLRSHFLNLLFDAPSIPFILCYFNLVQSHPIQFDIIYRLVVSIRFASGRSYFDPPTI